MTMYAGALMQFVKRAMDAVDPRPYRDRTEVIGIRDGKVVGMDFPDKSFGFYGGGVESGEDPAAAATREFFEESGLKVKNLRPSGVKPVTLDWTPGMLAENPKLQERAKTYRGSRTHYFVGDVEGAERAHKTDLDLGPSNRSQLKWLPYQQAIDRLRGNVTSVAAKDLQRTGINKARIKILKELLRAQLKARGQLKEAEDFAPGLPDPRRFGDVSQMPKDQLIKWVIQRHEAQRAGPHYDVRMGTPQTGLYSWATKKELPEPGGKTMLFQQPVHRYDYAGFQGRIPSGYGAGTVKTHDMGTIGVQEATNDKIKFFTAHKGTPEFYTMIRTTGPRKGPGRTERTQGGSWLLINTTPVKAPQFLGTDEQGMAKLKYKSIPAADVEKLFTKGNIVQNKVDGASMLYRLFGDHIEAVSYRIGKGGRPIIHTQRMFGPGGLKAKIPPELAGTVLRGEAYGTREGKAIPPQELGGLLNSAVAKSLEMQKQKGVQLRTMLFDVAGEQDKPYAERLAKLQKVISFLPKEKFHLPESATEPEAMKGLWERISTGKHPLTSEGIVSWPEKGPPTKVKVLPESDVWVKGVFPGEKGLAGVGAGGFEYGTSPEGPVVGRVGTGFSEEARKQMLADPEGWIGRMARIRSMGQFPGGAHRAPSFLALHEDYPNKMASLSAALKRRRNA